jgi:hypothetical protein
MTHTTEHATMDGRIITITDGKVVGDRPMTPQEFREWREYADKNNKHHEKD